MMTLLVSAIWVSFLLFCLIFILGDWTTFFLQMLGRLCMRMISCCTSCTMTHDRLWCPSSGWWECWLLSLVTCYLFTKPYIYFLSVIMELDGIVIHRRNSFEYPYVFKILHFILYIQERGCSVRFVWIPSHFGIEENELADSVARSWLKTNQISIIEN